MLAQASSLRRTQQKLALLSGENFNVFRILGLESREVVTHSAFLGELLNPAGSHGLKDIFLKLFTEAMNHQLLFAGKKAPEFNTATARLEVEHHIGRITEDYQQGGRIDLYLESAGEYIFIENKIYADDQQNQLARYQAHQKNARLLYLTLTGHEASEWSAGGLTADQYQVFSYKEDIAAWLEKCRQAAAAYPLVRETIVQYQHLINHLTGNAPNDFIKMEMHQLVQQSEENFVSASALKQAFEESQAAYVEELAEEFGEAWQLRFSENLSPLPEYAIYLRRLNNSYGFRAEKNGVEVAATEEEALRPVITLVLSIPKFRRDRNLLGAKWMEARYFDNLPPAELYRAVTDETARLQLFEDRLREAALCVDKFKELTRVLKPVA